MLPRRCYLGLMRVAARKIVLMHGVCMCVCACVFFQQSHVLPRCVLSHSHLRALSFAAVVAGMLLYIERLHLFIVHFAISADI